MIGILNALSCNTVPSRRTPFSANSRQLIFFSSSSSSQSLMELTKKTTAQPLRRRNLKKLIFHLHLSSHLHPVFFFCFSRALISIKLTCDCQPITVIYWLSFQGDCESIATEQCKRLSLSLSLISLIVYLVNR